MILTRELRNIYYCMRHGRSAANEAGIILSSPEDGILADWGLADGADEAIRWNIRESGLDGGVVIYSSPFSRTMQTAAIAAEVLGSALPTPAPELRERWFGDLERSSHENYRRVWEKDRLDVNNNEWSVESPIHVFERLRSFIRQTEREVQGKTVLLVSHGDPCDILLCAAGGRQLNMHMEEGMTTAEIRKLGILSAS